MNQYSINVTWSDEDDAFIATSPEFPGLSAFGATRAEAIEEAEIAMGVLIQVMEEDGTPLPQPLKKTTYSGQTRVRFPRSLHARLAALAEQEGVSLNTLINNAVSEYVGRSAAKIKRVKPIRSKTSSAGEAG